MNSKSKIITCFIVFFILLAGFAKGFSDTLQFHYSKSIFSSGNYSQNYFNPDISWHNKYQANSDSVMAFWGSTTFLVWTTDAWHLLQMIEFMSWMIALLLALRLGYGSRPFIIGAAISLYLIFHLGFWLAYDWLLLIR